MTPPRTVRMEGMSHRFVALLAILNIANSVVTNIVIIDSGAFIVAIDSRVEKGTVIAGG